MRILIFLSSTRIGGSERMALILANRWAARGHDIRLVVGSAGELHAAIAPSVKTEVLGLSRSRHAIWPLSRRLGSFRPDIAFAAKPDASLALFTACRIRASRSKLVLRESNHRTAQGIPTTTPFMRALGLAYRFSARVIAPSEGIRNDLAARYGLKRVTVLPNPVEIRDNEPRAADPTRARVVALGRLVPQKGYDLLLQAADRLRRECARPFELSVFGEGPERGALESRIRDAKLEGIVRLPGATSDPAACLRAADLFVLSSRFEGFPNALVEAMACGLPVVATRCPAGPDEIVDDGVSGLLCEPESDTALFDAMKRMLEDIELSRRCGLQAREKVMRFEASRVAAAYEAAFEEILS